MRRLRPFRSFLCALASGALLVVPGCSSDGGGDGDGSGADAGSGGGGGGGGGGVAPTSCGLSADHQVVFLADGSGWTYESEASGGLTIWRGTTPVSASAGPIAPGETVSLTVTFDPPLRVDRESNSLSLWFRPVSPGGSELRAVFQQDVEADGTMTLGGDVDGDWGLDASAQAATLSLSARSAIPAVGETLSCLSTRVAFNPIGYDAVDNSAIDTQPGGSVSWDGIVIEMLETSEVDTEPFAFSFAE